MKNAKEKAAELIQIFGKELALIAVDEILNAITFNIYEEEYDKVNDFWEEVKNEIEKL